MEPQEFTSMVWRETLASKDYSKVFCVGFNKTGTTSTEALLSLYGLKTPKQDVQETVLVKQTRKGNYTPLKNFVSQYDAFQDLPFSQGVTFIIADTLFPQSKFILTVRDSNQWFDSLCRYHKKVFRIENIENLTEKDIRDAFYYLYDGYVYDNISTFLTVIDKGKPRVRWDKLYDREFYIRKYEERNKAIQLYFSARPDDLLVIDITREKNTRRICDFLGIPSKYTIEMPHLNRSQV